MSGVKNSLKNTKVRSKIGKRASFMTCVMMTEEALVLLTMSTLVSLAPLEASLMTYALKGGV